MRAAIGESDEVKELRTYDRNSENVLCLRDCANAKEEVLRLFSSQDHLMDENKITEVSLELSKRCDDETVSLIAKRLKKQLRKVNLNASGSGDRGDIEQFSNLGVMSISEYQEEKLVALECFWNTKITSAAIESVCRFNTNLVVLNISGCLAVSEKGLRHISKLRKLKYLNMTRATHATDVAINEIIEGCTELEYFNLYANSQLSDDAFVNIDRLRNLTFFDACGFNKLTDKTLLKLPLNKLEYLNLSWCGEIEDAGACFVCENSPNLKLFSVHGNRNVTEEMIDSLKRGQQKQEKPLEVLDIKGCLNVKTTDFDALKELFPNLETIKFHT